MSKKCLIFLTFSFISGSLLNAQSMEIIDNSMEMESPANILELLATDTASATLYVPDAFTPNGDGTNDKLSVFGNFTDLRLSIYTLSGDLVYTMISQTYPWDGTYNDKAMPNGTYIWEALFIGSDEKEYTRKGKVVIIR
jgi:gliding motility-associated-like protein